MNAPPSQATKRLENWLAKTRTDLWAVSRILKWCKSGNGYSTDGLNKIVWDALSEEDQEIIRCVHSGRMPPTTGK